MDKNCNIFYCGGGIWKADPSREWMEKIGSDPYGIKIMMEKDQIFPIYVTNIYFGAGNILKQDMLSLGGDVVVHKFFVNAKKESAPILLLGTAKQYRLLQTKMFAQHWGLKELASDLKIIMENLLYYRETEELPISETLHDQEFPTNISVEEAMDRLPLHRGKTSGFIHIPKEKIADEKDCQKLFFPALSKGYYIN